MRFSKISELASEKYVSELKEIILAPYADEHYTTDELGKLGGLLASGVGLDSFRLLILNKQITPVRLNLLLTEFNNAAQKIELYFVNETRDLDQQANSYGLNNECLGILSTWLQSGNCPNDFSINFDNTKMTGGQVTKITEVIKSDKCSKHFSVHFAATQFDEDCMNALKHQLSSETVSSYLYIDLSKNALDTNSIQLLCEGIASAKFSKGLLIDISKCEISHESIALIADLIKSGQCPDNFELNLSGNKLSPNSLSILFQAIASPLCPKGLSVITIFSQYSNKVLNDLGRQIQFARIPQNLSLQLGLDSEQAKLLSNILFESRDAMNAGLSFPSDIQLCREIETLFQEKCEKVQSKDNIFNIDETIKLLNFGLNLPNLFPDEVLYSDYAINKKTYNTVFQLIQFYASHSVATSEITATDQDISEYYEFIDDVLLPFIKPHHLDAEKVRKHSIAVNEWRDNEARSLSSRRRIHNPFFARMCFDAAPMLLIARNIQVLDSDKTENEAAKARQIALQFSALNVKLLDLACTYTEVNTPEHSERTQLRNINLYILAEHLSGNKPMMQYDSEKQLADTVAKHPHLENTQQFIDYVWKHGIKIPQAGNALVSQFFERNIQRKEALPALSMFAQKSNATDENQQEDKPNDNNPKLGYK